MGEPVVGISFPYHQVYFPAVSGHLVSYPSIMSNPNTNPQPWKPLQLVASQPSSAGAACAGLLNLAAGHPAHKIQDQYQHKAATSQVGVAVPLKRSQSLSGIDENTRVKSPKVLRLSSTCSSSQHLTELAMVSQMNRSSSLFEPQPQSKSIEDQVGTSVAQITVSATANPADAQLLCSISQPFMTEGLCNEHPATTVKTSPLGSDVQMMTIAPNSAGKSFPYRHPFQVLQGNHSTSSIAQEPLPRPKPTKDQPMMRCEPLLSHMEFTRDPKTKQVKIRLDKESSGHLLAELLKLQASANRTATHGGKPENEAPEKPRSQSTSGLSLYRNTANTEVNNTKAESIARNILLTQVKAQVACPSPAVSTAPSLNQTINTEYVKLPFTQSRSDGNIYSLSKLHSEDLRVASAQSLLQLCSPLPVKTSEKYVLKALPRRTQAVLVEDQAFLQDLKNRLQYAENKLKASTRVGPYERSATTDDLPILSFSDLMDQPLGSSEGTDPGFGRSLGSLDPSSFLSEPGSGASSINLSPYLLGMLPDKIEDSDSDEVFLDEYITPDILPLRAKVMSSPATSQ